MKPIRNQILVKPFMGSDKTEGGIIIPESCRKESNRVLIVEVGNGTKQSEMKLEKGMIGYRVKDWGTPIVDNNETYYLMEQNAILAVE